ncbi:metal ABC transporter ATP-binding protein [Chitinispirillales bacterium ANBcel5]|uniref:metal ABC transporter ATP-binding protein n=1 Tax=Cellulosispirillum alkaliphilum TaxID=3039283 RepID=UPI002A4F6FAA|nr:metal ABC transporter ATP-binding protein [Chitinispirillales bacterium ANBcel5]
MDLLKFNNVTLGYGPHTILREINLKVRKGDFFGLVGPNGSGKSTLMKSMLGLVRPRHGSINWLSGVPKRGYVPQREQVDPLWPMRVRDLLRLTLCSADSALFYNRKEQVQVGKVMELTEIEHLRNQTLDTLSGGEMQRVLLARALIIEPDVLFLDEPTAAMDLVASQKFLSIITGIHHSRNVTVILVTHDLQSLVDRAHRLGIIQNGALHSDTADKLLTSINLSTIYKEPMVVKKVEGRTVIFPEKTAGEIKR